MSRKQGRYTIKMTEDDVKKEMYREIWYSVRSEIRKDNRPAGVINFKYSYCGVEVTDSLGCSFIGTIAISNDC